MIFLKFVYSGPLKVSNYGVISGPYFPAFGLEKTLYLHTFHAVPVIKSLEAATQMCS